MTIRRAGTVLMFLGFALPAGLIWQTLPARADRGGADAVADADPVEDDLRARRAAPALAVNFNALNVGDPNPALTSHATSKN